jgi:hypothetical protein
MPGLLNNWVKFQPIWLFRSWDICSFMCGTHKKLPCINKMIPIVKSFLNQARAPWTKMVRKHCSNVLKLISGPMSAQRNLHGYDGPLQFLSSAGNPDEMTTVQVLSAVTGLLFHSISGKVRQSGMDQKVDNGTFDNYWLNHYAYCGFGLQWLPGIVPFINKKIINRKIKPLICYLFIIIDVFKPSSGWSILSI